MRGLESLDFFGQGAGSSSDEETEYSPSCFSSEDDDSANVTVFLARLPATRTSPGGCLAGLGGGEGDGMDPRKSPTTECVPKVAAALIFRWISLIASKISSTQLSRSSDGLAMDFKVASSTTSEVMSSNAF